MSEKLKMKDTIRTYFKENRESIRGRIIDLTKEMVKEKTVNVVSEKLNEFPFLKIRGEEYRVAEIVKRTLDSSGITYEEFSRMEGRPNVIGKIGKNVNGRRLLMPAHMDIVPAGEDWDTDPFEAIEIEDKLYGRGTLDNKGPLASILVAGQLCKEMGLADLLDGELQLAALSDEEAEDPDGIDYGIGFLMEEKHINPTMAIIPDIGGFMKEIDVAEKGRTVFKITAFGEQAHGSTPEKGINAVFMMARLVTEIEKLKFDYEEHPVLKHPTLNLGEMHGGAAPNIVPGKAYIYIDIRTVPGQSKEKITAQLQECCGKVENGKFEVTCMSWNEPHGIDPANELVKAIQENSKEVLGFEPKTMGMGGGTYAKTLNLNNVTAVGWGPGDEDAFHVSNEYVSIKELVDFAEMTLLVAVDLLS